MAQGDFETVPSGTMAYVERAVAAFRQYEASHNAKADALVEEKRGKWSEDQARLIAAAGDRRDKANANAGLAAAGEALVREWRK